MDRRRFLTASTAAGLAIAAKWPYWLTSAFGEESKKKSRADEVKEAYARARRDHRPLLVLLIPIDTNETYLRGRTFGEFINHGGARGLKDLLGCERVCATIPDVIKALPGLNLKIADDPIMLLIEPGQETGKLGAAARALVINPDIATDPSSSVRADGTRGAIEDAIPIRIKQVGDALHNALFQNGKSLAERARANRAALTDEERQALTKAGGVEKIDPALVERGALYLRHAAVLAAAKGKSTNQLTEVLESLAKCERIGKLLAAAAKARVLEERPAGAKWANSSGCGTKIEGEAQNLAFACGMGHVPELSRRFLWFYTR